MAPTSPRIGSLIGRLLKLTQPDGVDAHQRQNRQTEHYECDVEHDRLLAGAVLSVEPRKLSIANRAPARKDFISFASGCGWAPRRVCSWTSQEITSRPGKRTRARCLCRRGNVQGRCC